jgi:hypothetical protein
MQLYFSTCSIVLCIFKVQDVWEAESGVSEGKDPTELGPLGRANLGHWPRCPV